LRSGSSATFVHQTARRSIAETIAAGWSLLDALPRDDLIRISEATWTGRHGGIKRA
jgi:vacuolar-type H+-ATPase subunit B/Vma2